MLCDPRLRACIPAHLDGQKKYPEVLLSGSAALMVDTDAEATNTLSKDGFEWTYGDAEIFCAIDACRSGFALLVIYFRVM